MLTLIHAATAYVAEVAAIDHNVAHVDNLQTTRPWPNCLIGGEVAVLYGDPPTYRQELNSQ